MTFPVLPGHRLGAAALCVGAVTLALAFRWNQAGPAGVVGGYSGIAERAPLGLRPLLERGEHYLSSTEHNPTGIAFLPEDELRLQWLIDSANDRILALQSQLGEIARDWARLCIAIGNFDQVEPGVDRRHHEGTLLLRVTDRYGIRRDVVIRPGECAELDVLTADIDGEIEAAHRQITEFLESRADRSNPFPEEVHR